MIKEVIVVEGRDDTAAISRAVKADTIETHGYGIAAETWALLEKAYEARGLIIFTDPDHAGEEIRKRLSEKFPNARHAYLDRESARDGSDIGIENAGPAAIKAALEIARAKDEVMEANFSKEDMTYYGLVGEESSAALRAEAGKRLGIGNGNAKAFLKKLNAFGITRDELETCITDITKKP